MSKVEKKKQLWENGNFSENLEILKGNFWKFQQKDWINEHKNLQVMSSNYFDNFKDSSVPLDF